MPLTTRAGFGVSVSVSEPDPQTVLMKVTVLEGERIKGVHEFHFKKHPNQSADDLCRAAFAMAFEEVAS